MVPHWNKFEELIGILEASLQDIDDRWTDGKVGPCMAQFSSVHIVHDNFINFVHFEKLCQIYKKKSFPFAKLKYF